MITARSACLPAIALFLLATTAVAVELPPCETTAVFIPGQEGYPTYRIPGAVVSNQGTIMAFAEGRKGGGGVSGDVDIVLKRSFNGGQTWGPLQIAVNDGPNTIANPTPVVDRTTGTIWLTFNRWLGSDSIIDMIKGESEDTTRIWVTKSTDDGDTWYDPVDITSQVKDPGWGWYTNGPGVGIQMRNDRLVIPGYHIPTTKVDAEMVHTAHTFYSDDYGLTWHQGGSIETYDPSTEPGWNVPGRTDESQVVELVDGRLLMNMRTYHNAYRRSIAYSDDGGESWGDVTLDMELFEPICQGSILRYTDTYGGYNTNRILFSNPNGRTPSGARFIREKLTVRMSYDEGETWPVAKEIESGLSAYSCLTVLPDQRIGCLYEKGPMFSETIIFGRYTLEWLTDGGDNLDTGPIPPVPRTIIDFVDLAASTPVGDRLVPATDGQADGGADNTYGSAPGKGIREFETPSIDLQWGYDPAGPGDPYPGNSDHWIAVFKDHPATEAFFTPNGSGNLNQTPEPIIVSAEEGWLVQLEAVKIRTGGNSGYSSQSKLFVDAELIFDTGTINVSGGYLQDDFVDLSGIEPSSSHAITFEFYRNGGLSVNNSAISLLEFSQVPVVQEIPGDANGDGMVTDADAAILASHWQQQTGATWADGDFSGDGKVTDADAAILASHWQEGVQAAPVPEPSALAVLVLIVAFGLGGRLRR